MKNRLNISILKITLFLLLSTLITIVYADDSKEGASKSDRVLDSLNNLITNAGSDTAKVRLLNVLNRKMRVNKPKLAIESAFNAIALIEKMEQEQGVNTRDLELRKAETYGNLGMAYWTKGSNDQSLKYLNKSLVIYQNLNDEEGLANVFNYLGNTYLAKGSYDKALDYYYKSLRLSEKLEDQEGVGICYGNIGNVYWSQDEYDQALEYHRKSLDIDIERDNEDGITISYGNIGIIYILKEELDTALIYLKRSLEGYKRMDDKGGVASTFNNLAIVEKKNGNISEALKYLFEALEVAKEIDSQMLIASSYNNIGDIYTKIGKTEKAIKYLNMGIELAKKMKAKYNLQMLYSGLASAYEKAGDFELAYKNYQIYTDYMDSVYNEDKAAKIADLRTTYDLESKEKEIKILTKENEIKALLNLKQEADLQEKQYIIVAVIVFLGLAMALAFLLYNRYQIKSKANYLLEEKNQEISTKNKHITDSISYASRIQTAILPPLEAIQSSLPDSFVFYKQKEIVSGDFYWFTKLSENEVVLVVCDCTGHGVPGAFMSMIGNDLLNQNVLEKGVTKPSDILNNLHSGVRFALRQEGIDSEAKDGMDIAVCKINVLSKNIEFAGAHRPIWLVNNEMENGSEKLRILKGDKIGIGGLDTKERNFNNQDITIKNGEIIYMFSDGFADQFGGPKNKKYKAANFKKFITALSTLPITDQKEKLETELKDWRGDYEQTDDITVIGFKLT